MRQCFFCPLRTISPRGSVLIRQLNIQIRLQETTVFFLCYCEEPCAQCAHSLCSHHQEVYLKHHKDKVPFGLQFTSSWIIFKGLPQPIIACLALFLSARRTIETVIFFGFGVVFSLLDISEKLLSFEAEKQEGNLKQCFLEKSIIYKNKFTSNIYWGCCNTISMHKSFVIKMCNRHVVLFIGEHNYSVVAKSLVGSFVGRFVEQNRFESFQWRL